MIIQEGNTTSVEADMVREKRFARYVTLSLRRYAARWIRGYRTRISREPAILNEPGRDEDGRATEMGYLLAASDLSAEDAFLLAADLAEVLTLPSLYCAYVKLTDTQRLVLGGLTVDGLRQEELARALHVSQQAICKTKALAIKRLRSAV